MKKALFPGSFNPLHKGHISIYKKATKLFDEVIFYVTFNPEKNNTNDIKQRANIIESKIPNAKVIYGYELSTTIAEEQGCKYLVRGFRNDSDIKYELALASGNKQLNSKIETILIMSDNELKNISSTSKRLVEKSIKIAKEHR